MKNEKIIGIGAFIIVFCVSTYVSYQIFNTKASVEINSTTATSTGTLGTTTSLTPGVTVSVSPLKESTFKLFYVALSDGGVNGQKLGCDDSLVGMKYTVPYTPSPLRVSLEKLLAERQKTIHSSQELYNSLAQSSLKLAHLSLIEGTATIKLEGELVSGGVCDDPRIDAQIRATAMQFPSVHRVDIFINNKPIAEVLSGR